MTANKRHDVTLLGCIFALSAAGAWISGELVKEHAGRWTDEATRGGLFTRVCEATAGAGFDCAGALNSPWGFIKIPLPVPSSSWGIGVHTVVVPVAFLGLAYFIFVGVWFAIAGRPKRYGYRWQRIPLGIGLCAVAGSLFYVGVMATGTTPWCVWCLVVHVINLLLVVALWRCGAGQHLRHTATTVAGVAEEPHHIARETTTFRQAMTASAVALILITGLWVHRRDHLAFRRVLRNLQPFKAMVTSLQEDPEFLLREFHAQPQRDIPLRPEEPSDGRYPQLAVFTDFECPACHCNALSTHRTTANSFDGQLTMLVRHYPLDNACNANVKSALHPNACDAAYAAEAARLQGGDAAFTRMYAMLFENRKALGPDLYRNLAARIGLDAERLMGDMHSTQVREIIESDIRLAEALGVSSTPTMFLNGRRVTALCRTPAFWDAAAQEWNGAAQRRVGEDSSGRAVAVMSETGSSGQE